MHTNEKKLLLCNPKFLKKLFGFLKIKLFIRNIKQVVLNNLVKLGSLYYKTLIIRKILIHIRI